jgi:rhodanese-related sulfurtransferase
MLANAKTLNQRVVVLDVRNSYEWDAGHFVGAERPVESEFCETPRADDPIEGLPRPLRGLDPKTPVMVRLKPPVEKIVRQHIWLLWHGEACREGIQRGDAWQRLLSGHSAAPALVQGFPQVHRCRDFARWLR